MVVFNYGISQEDALTENRALNLESGDRLLCVASAGEVPLNLLALNDIHITSVDTDLHQIYLCRLKLLVAKQLVSLEAAGFLGYMSMPSSERLRIYASLKGSLDSNDRHFWDQRSTIIADGVVKAGRFEKYISRFRPIATAIIGKKKLTRLLSMESVLDQQDYYDENISSIWLKGLFKIIFHPLIYKNRGIHIKGLSNEKNNTMADFFYGRLRDFCSSTCCRSNYYFQYTFFGEVLYPEALPEFLQPQGQSLLRQRHLKLNFEHISFSKCLKNYPNGHFNKIHMSNIGDWMSPIEFEGIMDLIYLKAAPKSEISYRYIHGYHPLQGNMKSFFREHIELGEDLMRKDRYPFYSLIPIQYNRQPKEILEKVSNSIHE